MTAKHLLAGLLLAGLGGPEPRPVVRVFFSPDSPDASPIFRQLEGVEVRPVLLVGDYFAASRPKRAFLETLRVSGEVAVWNPEGLVEARALGITSLPAVAVTVGECTHVAFGTRVNVKELIQCSR